MTGHPETDAAGAAMADPQAASPAELPLPHVSVGGLDGMLRILSGRGGFGDLPELAGRLSLEVDDLIPLTDAAQLLGFAEVDNADIKLTPIGQQWAQASPSADKKIFAEQARDRAPLVRTIVRALSEAPGGKLSKQFFLDLLEHDFTHEQARAQLDTAINWGRYGQLYSYHAHDGQLVLTAAAGPAGLTLEVRPAGQSSGRGRFNRVVRDGPAVEEVAVGGMPGEEDQRYAERHGYQHGCRRGRARLSDHLVTYPEAEGPREEREQHAGEEEPGICQHDLSVCPRAGDARRAVVEGDEYADVGNEVSVSRIDGRGDGPQENPGQARPLANHSGAVQQSACRWRQARVWRWHMQGSRNYVYSRQYVADSLRRQGFPELAAVALRELPDPVGVEQLESWGMRYGVSKDDLISRMGGSP